MAMVIERMLRILNKPWNSKLYSEFRLVRVSDKCKVAVMTDNFSDSDQLPKCLTVIIIVSYLNIS